MIKEEMLSTLPGKIGLLLSKNAFVKLREALDYENYGGAPILGINGIGIVCHGSSSERAIKNGVRRAAEYFENDFMEKLTNSMEEFGMDLAKAS
jgi:glycerol-3-phosphate acyltransferase PlsX